MKEFLFALSLGLFSLFLQATSLGLFFPVGYKPDLTLTIVVWSSLRFPFSVGIAFAFCVGILTDALSGGPTGLFALLYSIVFIFCNYLSVTVVIDIPAIRFGIVALGTAFSGLMIAFLRLVSDSFVAGAGTLSWILVKSLVTGLSAIVLIPLMDKIWVRYAGVVGLR